MTITQRDMLERATAAYAADYDTDGEAHDYLEGTRGLGFATIGRLRFGVVRHPITASHNRFRGMIAIPNLGASSDGHPVGIDFRSITGRKHDRPEGDKIRLYNLRALTYADDVIYVTEGSIDAASLEDVGLPAIGVPGANQWGKAHAYRNRIVEGFRVVLLRDSDDAGALLVKDMADIDGLTVRDCLPAKDANELLTTQGPAALYARATGT